ncbi:cupin domain-containing protein [Rhodobacteraceae bacterium NNCM2]|nr:cupin domain-containing protein [Coraliihabitans acroporae]
MTAFDSATMVGRLADLPDLNPEPDSEVRRFAGERVMLQDARMRAGCTFDAHSHHNEQLVIVLSGRVRLDIGTDDKGVESIILSGGDYIILPPHTVHGGEALEDCHLIDAFNPPRTTFVSEPEPEAQA